jgi:hypothetical protein
MKVGKGRHPIPEVPGNGIGHEVARKEGLLP